MSQTFYQQCLTIKQQYPDTLLFFRLGDYCEAYNEDARTVANVLGRVVVLRVVSFNQSVPRVPMAFVPHYAFESEAVRLIKAGYKVAICEPVGSEAIKGLVPREVVQV